MGLKLMPLKYFDNHFEFEKGTLSTLWQHIET